MRDLNNIPIPSTVGEQLFLVEKAKYSTKSEEVKNTYIETEVQKIVILGGNEKKARKAILSKVENQILHPYDCVLSNENVLIRVSAIIENPEKYNGMYIRDPIEPEKGMSKAIINAENGKVSIYAYRHGGVFYNVRDENFPVTVANSDALGNKSILEQTTNALTIPKDLKTNSSRTDNKIYINQFSNTLIQKLQYTGRFSVEEIIEQVLTCGIPIMSYAYFLYLYLDGFWQKHEQSEIEKKIFVKAIVEKITGGRASSQQVNKIFNELHYEYNDTNVYSGTIINYLNCTLKIENGVCETVEHDPKFGLKYKLKFPYMPQATCPLMDNFLMDVIGEQEAINVFWEFVGSVFIKKNDQRLEKAMFLFGRGSNGKSVLLDILKELFGKSNISSVPLNKMTKEEDRQLMVSKLFNIAAEGDSKKINSEVFKTIVAREPLSIRVLYHNPQEIDDFPKLIFATNHIPTTTDTSDGMSRRIIIIYFSKVIPDAQQDKELFKKLSAELPGIMNRVLEGMNRLLSNKGKNFTYSPMIEKAKEQFIGQNNPVKYFMKELKFEKQDSKFPIYCSKKLYIEFKHFCLEEGIRQNLSKKAFVGLVSEIFGAEEHSNSLYGWKIKKKTDLTQKTLKQYSSG